MYQLYKITNKKNGKFYIGVHKGDIFDDGYYGSGLLMNRAIKKYGEAQFLRRVMKEYTEEQEAYADEKLILNTNLIQSDRCYNLMEGGIRGPTQYGNNYAKGIEPWNKGMKMPQYSKENHPRSIFSKKDRESIISKYKAGQSSTDIAQEYGTNKGTICYLLRSENVTMRTNKDYDFLSGEDHPNWVDKDEDKICSRYKNGESTYEIADDLGVTDATIGKVLKRNGVKRKTNKAYISKMVIQYTEEGVFVSIYKSLKNASKYTGIYYTNICRASKGERSSAGGFKWERVN
jgi:DNA-binding NarL/FixJ family response regulator